MHSFWEEYFGQVEAMQSYLNCYYQVLSAAKYSISILLFNYSKDISPEDW